ncbi:MAG: c-type cytochrome [Pseudomonadales bacterium]|jgi:cytochrome c5
MKFLTRALLVAATLGLTGCGEPEQTGTVEDTAETATATEATTPPDYMAQWARSCALCHVNGEGGAPRVGDAEAWTPRVAKGDDVLLQHTVEGFNNMPPLGYCMDCEAEDFRQIIRFMASGT